ncbi:MAG: SulP family inorganic anion transporter [Actinomycetota bacterium]|nr:SulP family inorganic anion transporter [Actinomycetota bacterium]MDP2288294.1 SulP family inorganic anion transporter [Actinomycetota bacterium]
MSLPQRHAAKDGDGPNAVRTGLARLRELLPIRKDYADMRRDPKRDVIAGVTVAFVALPLALAFGLSSGMGAAAGLTTAIVAGIVAAIFGGSNLQVSGPTGAMTVVLIPIFTEFGASGVLVVGMLAGLVLIVLAFVRAGRAMQYIPLPVVEGFTLGIAVIIALQQIPSALGTTGQGEKVFSVAASSIQTWFAHPNWAPVAITFAVAGTILLLLRLRPGLPSALPAVIGATVVASLMELPVSVIGALPDTMPIPSLPTVSIDMYSALLLPAIAVAALAALESLLSATVADGMSVGEHHNSNRELFGQGMANLAAPLFGGVPATAAIARTAVNVRTGARSRLAAITQSAALLLVIVIASQWVSKIPMAALAGVLLATCVQMVEVSNLRSLMRSTRGDAAILLATALATIVFDLVTAVVIGMVVAGIYALRQVARSANVDRTEVTTEDHSVEEQALLREHVVAFRLDGPLFFGAAHKFLLEIAEISDVRVVILRLSRVHTLDATGATVLGDTIKSLEHRGITVLLSGVSKEHDSIFRVLGIYEHLADERHLFATTPEAIEHARRHIAHQDHTN